MSFLYPYVLFALLLPLALAVGAVASLRRSGRGWHRLVSAEHEGELVVTRPAWRTLLPALLCVAALVCAVAALARPINGYREAGALSNSRNLLLALDISRSMETQDVSPSRLEEARMAAYELIDALPNDKIGLIVFSGTADLVVPLTYDHTALRDALEQVNRGWAGAGGTNFGQVLQKAMQDFKRSAPDGTNALVLLSDGEDTADTSRNIEKEAKENHLMVITVGVGTAAGGPIPDANGDNGLWQDAEGKHVISKLDTESLQAFAKATGGSYFQMGQHSDLADFARRAVQKLDAHEENVSLNKVPNDLFAYFAAAALVLLLLAIPLATDWKRPRRLMLLPALLLLAAMGSPAAKAAEKSAVEAYRSGLEQATADPAKAKDAISLALLDKDPHLQAAGHCAIGNINTRATFEELRALYEGGSEEEDAAPAAAGQPSADDLQKIVDKLKENRTPYLDALAADAAWSAAQKNLDKIDELIKKLEEEIERLKQQEQQQQNENNQQQNQDNQQSGDNEQQQDKQQGDNKDDKQQGEQGQDDADPQQNQGDKPEQQQEQQNDKQNDPQQQNQDGQQQPDNQEPQQDKNDQNAPQQQPEQKPEEQQQEAADNANDKERAEQRAASILKMHLDEEHGSPIPHLRDNNRPPKKDY